MNKRLISIIFGVSLVGILGFFVGVSWQTNNGTKEEVNKFQKPIQNDPLVADSSALQEELLKDYKNELYDSIERGLPKKWIGRIELKEYMLKKIRNKGGHELTDLQISAQAIRSIVTDAVTEK